MYSSEELHNNPSFPLTNNALTGWECVARQLVSSSQGVDMRRIKTFAGFALLALAAMLTSTSNRNQTFAADWYSCKLTATCPSSARCEGDRWMRTGDCSISCYKESGAPGEIVFSGSANCGASSEGRPMGDFPSAN